MGSMWIKGDYYVNHTSLLYIPNFLLIVENTETNLSCGIKTNEQQGANASTDKLIFAQLLPSNFLHLPGARWVGWRVHCHSYSQLQNVNHVPQTQSVQDTA